MCHLLLIALILLMNIRFCAVFYEAVKVYPHFLHLDVLDECSVLDGSRKDFLFIFPKKAVTGSEATQECASYGATIASLEHSELLYNYVQIIRGKFCSPQ